MTSSSLCHSAALTSPVSLVPLTIHPVLSLRFGSLGQVRCLAYHTIATRYLQANIISGKRSLTRPEFELAENSSVLFQEIVALLLGSESIRHIDLSNVLSREPTAPPSESSHPAPSPSNQGCEVVPPIILLWKSLQTRCNSISLDGNSLGVSDIAGLCKFNETRVVTLFS